MDSGVWLKAYRQHLNIRYGWYIFFLKISINLYQQVSQMNFLIEIKYFHPELNIGLENIKSAWLLSDINNPVELRTIIHQGLLSYRLPISGKRISYRTLKKGLIKKKIIIHLPLELLPF